MSNALLDAANAFARDGFRVLPCHGIVNEHCTCGSDRCGSAGKHPRLKRGLHDASHDERQLQEWWRRWPNANIGLVTDGTWVLDCDGDAGLAALADLEYQHELLPQTWKVKTGTGEHIYFAKPDGVDVRCRTNVNGLKLDVRAVGGYVLAPPSLHRLGQRYRWLTSPNDCELAAAPDWLLELVLGSTTIAPHQRPTRNPSPSSPEVVERARRYLSKLPPAISGNNGHGATFGAALALVKGFELSEPDTMALLGEYSQRCEPPWSQRELKHKVESATKNGKRPSGYLLGQATKGGANGASTRAATAATEGQWLPLIPLDQVETPVPFPTEHLKPTWLRDWVQETARATQTPVDIPALAALGVLSLAASGLAEVQVSPSWVEPLTLYLLGIAESGANKSAVLRQATRPVLDYERELNEQRQDDITQDRISRLRAKAKLTRWERQLLKDADADVTSDVLAAQRILDTPELRPFSLIVSDATVEAVTLAMAGQKGQVGWVTSEGSEVISLIGGRYDKHQTNYDALLKAWGAEPLRINRISRPPVVIDEPHLVVVALAQPVTLGELGRLPHAVDRGLTGRILYSVPESMVGRRKATVAGISTATQQGYDRQIGDLLRLPRTARRTLILSSEAEHLRVHHYDSVEKQLQPGEKLFHLRSWASKSRSHLVRLAALTHLAIDTDNNVITEDTMQAAVALMGYFEGHAIRAFAAIGIDEDVRQAGVALEFVRRWAALDEHGRRAVDFRSIHQRCRRSLTKTQLTKAMDVLVERGYLRPLTERTVPVVGQPSPRWELRPEMLA